MSYPTVVSETLSAAQMAAAREADGLTRGMPSAAGVDADAVVAFLDDVEAADLELHSLMLWRRGQVVAEAWRWPYRPDRPRILHSVAKGFTACAIGLAIEDRLLRLDDKVVSFFPEVSAARSSNDWLAEMTVEDLLTMRVGHEAETSGAQWRMLETSWIAEFFKIPLVQRPGTVFKYTSAASYMLSAILTRVTGQTLHGYLKPRIFEPLGIQGESWDIGPDGINPGGNGLTAKTVDLLKLGVLHLQGGVWQGKRLLPEHWVKAATAPHGEPIVYGYHWWARPNGNFSAIGRFVQMATAFPRHDAVLCVTGAIRGSGRLTPHIDAHFPAAFVDRIEDGAAADARLISRLTNWQRPDAPVAWKAPHASSDAAPRDDVSGVAPNKREQRFEMVPNAYGVTAIELGLTDRTRIVFRLFDADGVHVIEAGLDAWLEGKTDMPGSDLHHGYRLQDSAVVARAAWSEGGARLTMTWIFPETAFRDTVTCDITEQGMTLKREVNINGGPLRHDDLVGQRLA